MLKTFRIVAVLEGISYLVILANMLFIKPTNFELYKTLLFPFGMAHGILFMAYILLALLLKKQQNWDSRTLLFILGCSMIPFGTFYIEKKYLKNA